MCIDNNCEWNNLPGLESVFKPDRAGGWNLMQIMGGIAAYSSGACAWAGPRQSGATR